MERGWITPEQLVEAYAEQARSAKPRPIGNILAARGILSDERLIALLEELKGAADGLPAAGGGSSFPIPFGKYSLLREIGRGGMGVVYEAVDKVLERKVALKVVLPRADSDADQAREDSERFMREARLSANLSKHPNIVGVYDAGVIDGRCYLAMEYIVGSSLSKWRGSSGAALREEVRILRDVARGVHHAHAHGVIHRDLKPDNILLDTSGRPHVTDFGLAKSLDPGVSASLTAQGKVMGTPVYMSPEQAQGLPTIDHRTDIYSMAVMLYEVLAGRPPFTAKSAIEILMKVVREAAPPPLALAPAGAGRGGDASLESLCLKGIAKDPEKRYSTAEEFATALEGWLKGSTAATKGPASAASPPSLSEKPSPAVPGPAELLPSGPLGPASSAAPPGRPGRAGRVIVALLLLLAAAAAGAWFLVLGPRQRDLWTARAMATVGHRSEALAAYDRILKQTPGDPEAVAGRKTLVAEQAPLPSSAHAKPMFPPKPPKAAADPAMEAANEAREAEAVRASAIKAAAALLAHHTGPVNPAFIGAVAVLPPEEQVPAVLEKLRELNQRFPGKAKHRVEAGKVVELSLASSLLSDLSPLRALPDLKMLDVTADWDVALNRFVRGALSDLGPLRGLALRRLRIQGNAVKDLSPLKGMPLNLLRCDSTEVADLSPLAGMPLTWLDCAATPVVDLAPLEGMPLELLACSGTRVADLSPLRNMPLHRLYMHATKVTDLSPILRLPLQVIRLDYVAERDAIALRSMKTLTEINELPAVEFLSRFGHPWESVFDGKNLEGLLLQPKGGWTLEKAGLLSGGKDSTLLTRAAFEDGEFRIRFRCDSVGFLSLALRHANEKGYAVVPELSQINTPRGKVHEVIFTCREDQVFATLDGSPAPIKYRNGPRRGPLQIHAMGGHLTLLSIDRRSRD